MRWLSMYSAICRTYTPRHSVHLRYPCISVHPQSLLEDVLGGRDRACLEMHLETKIEWTQRCTWRPGSSEFGDALGDREIEWTQRCTWRPWLSEFGDALGGRDRVNSEMHLEAVIERVGRYTWRPWSNKIGGVLGGGWSGSDWSEGVQSGGSQSGGSESGGSESGGGRSGGMCDGSWDSIYWLTRNCGNVENWVQQGPLRAWETGWERETVDLGMMQVRGVCSTRCMQYSVYGVLDVCCTRWMLYSVYAVLGVCCTRCPTHDHNMER